MLISVLIFFLFFAFTVYLRFNIGNPIFSSRLQTKYKFQSIPNILNIALFLNKSAKPVSLHIIIFQLQNYISFIIFLIVSFKNANAYISYIKTECIAGFIIVILPLFIEAVYNIIIGECWTSVDGKIELSFDDYEIDIKDRNEHTSVLKFATYFNNTIIIYDNKCIPLAKGTVNHKKREITFYEVDEKSLCTLKSGEAIAFKKQTKTI